MCFEYNEKPISYMVNGVSIQAEPLSESTIRELESMGGAIVTHHTKRKLLYDISFSDCKYGLSVFKGMYTKGNIINLFGAEVTLDGVPCKTDITPIPIGYLEEEDVLTIARLVNRLDENGHIKPLKTSQI